MVQEEGEGPYVVPNKDGVIEVRTIRKTDLVQ